MPPLEPLPLPVSGGVDGGNAWPAAGGYEGIVVTPDDPGIDWPPTCPIELGGSTGLGEGEKEPGSELLGAMVGPHTLLGGGVGQAGADGITVVPLPSGRKLLTGVRCSC